MIKLENINKYYFKGERHQIHVVNNVTKKYKTTVKIPIWRKKVNASTANINPLNNR